MKRTVCEMGGGVYYDFSIEVHVRAINSVKLATIYDLTARKDNSLVNFFFGLMLYIYLLHFPSKKSFI